MLEAQFVLNAFLLAHACRKMSEVARLIICQLGECTFFSDFAIRNYGDAVTLFNSRETVGNDDAGAAHHALAESVLNLPLGLLVERAGCFVQQ